MDEMGRTNTGKYDTWPNKQEHHIINLFACNEPTISSKIYRQPNCKAGRTKVPPTAPMITTCPACSQSGLLKRTLLRDYWCQFDIALELCEIVKRSGTNCCGCLKTVSTEILWHINHPKPRCNMHNRTEAGKTCQRFGNRNLRIILALE